MEMQSMERGKGRLPRDFPKILVQGSRFLKKNQMRVHFLCLIELLLASFFDNFAWGPKSYPFLFPYEL
jgi:hypothetical protein